MTPWEKQVTETTKAFDAFRRYRDMGPTERSLQKVADQLGCTRQNVENWSSKHSWVERVSAFDSQQDKLALRMREVELEEARNVYRREQAALLTAMSQITARKVADIRNNVLREDGDVDSIELVRLTKVAVDLDLLWRRLLGLATANRVDTVDPEIEEVFFIGEKDASEET